MGYLKHTVKGISWAGALKAVIITVGMLRVPILARVLTPVEFGIFAIATLILSFVEILTETGINVFLVQEEEPIDKYIHTAWIVAIIRGMLISLLIIIAAWPVSQFFHTPNAFSLLLAISIVPFIKGFINPAVVQFQKNLTFEKEFRFRFVIILFESTVTIIAAFATHTAAAFVFGFIASALLEVLLSFLFLRPLPRFIFEAPLVRTILYRGKWITLAGIFNYLYHNVDNMVVGRILGASQLGLYQMAYRISSFPITEVADVISKVTFPVYAKIGGDRKRLTKAFIKTTFGISALVIPVGALLFFFPGQIITIILGSRWVEAAPALQVLSIFGVIRAISGSSSALFLALQKQHYVTVVTFVSILGLGVSIVPLVGHFGIVGAGISALVGSIVALPFFFYYAFILLRS